MKFKKNVISNLTLQILSIAIGFCTSILIARGLGTENQGEFSYYLLIFGIIASYGHIGITSANSYFIKKKKMSSQDVINNNISSLLVLSCIYIGVVIIFKDIIFSNGIFSLIMIWSVYAVTLLFNNYFITIYVADENIYIYNKFFKYIYILKGIIIALLYYTNKLNITTVSALYAILEIIKIFLLIKKLKIKYKFNIDTKILKEEFKYGIPLYLAGLFIYLNYRVDQISVKQILGNSELGIYSIAVHLADLAFIFPESIVSAFEGRLYSCKQQERKQISAQIIKFTFYSTFIICIIGILCKPLVPILYGIEYEKAGTVMTILLTGIIFASIGKVAPAYFYTEGKAKIHLYVSGTVLVINLILNSICIPKIGINGAALASTVSYLFYGIIYIVMLRKSEISIKQMLTPSKDDFNKIKESLNKIKNRKAI